MFKISHPFIVINDSTIVNMLFVRSIFVQDNYLYIRYNNGAGDRIDFANQDMALAELERITQILIN